jgi:hypothetical protein
VTALRVTGDFGKLRTLSATLKATPRLRDAILAEQGEKALELYRNGFASRRDPYGAAWAPGPDLVESGDLLNAAIVPFADGFRLRSAKHGFYHQHGWIVGKGRKALLAGMRGGRNARGHFLKNVGGVGRIALKGKERRAEQKRRLTEVRATLVASGAAHVPARKIQPTAANPGLWGSPLRNIVTRAFLSHLRGGR